MSLPTDPQELESLAADKVRRAAVAGRFYPGPAAALQRQVNELLQRARTEPLRGIRALVVPHAGYIYSGAVAAAAYAALGEDAYRRVVVIAPSHRVLFGGVATCLVEAFETPLGSMPLDFVALARLAAEYPSLADLPAAHKPEHAIEVQLPFLQTVLPHARLVPLIMGDQGESAARELGQALSRTFGDEETLVVASSDLSHYLEDSVARVLDGVVSSRVQALDPEGLLEDVEREQAAACGAGPIAAAMFFARELGIETGLVLGYATSGDVTGERGQVVGYLAAAFRLAEADENHDLTRREQQALLRLARESLRRHLAGEAPPDLDEATPRLLEHRGAFVTLTKHGQLRGCIGYVEPVLPLWEAVREMAVSAAVRDPRFASVTAAELDRLHIEISALSPLDPCPDPGRIVLGRHGLIIRHGRRSGLLLPQVPLEQGWTREEFLRHTCLKAGLPPDAWRGDAELLAFTAQVFGE